MLLAALSVLVVTACAAEYTEFKPAIPVIEEYSHSAKVTINADDVVPEGTVKVFIQAKELDDLTGNVWEAGYEFPFNSAVPYFYYPQLDSGKYHEFRLKYGQEFNEYTQYSEASQYARANPVRYELEEIARTWMEAKEYCVQHHMHLITIHGEAMNTEVKNMLNTKDKDSAWIGLFDEHYNDNDDTTTWSWTDGHTKYSFENFEVSAEVKNSEWDSSAVAINAMGEWETHSPDEKRAFFCMHPKHTKVPHEDSSLGIVRQA